VQRCKIGIVERLLQIPIIAKEYQNVFFNGTQNSHNETKGKNK